MSLLKLDQLLSGEIDMALKRRAKTILEELGGTYGQSVLDAGCGWGYYLNLIVRLGVRNLKLAGFDIDKDSLKKARKAIGDSRIKLIQGDITRMPFKNDSFDVVIVSEVLEHLENDVKALKEVKRVLKKGGKLLLTVPNHDYPFFWDPVNWTLERLLATHVKSGLWRGIWSNHLRLYTLEEMESLVKAVGFKIIRAKPLTWCCLPFNGYLLYGGKLPPSVAAALLKQFRAEKKPALIQLILWILNAIDRLNDVFPSQKSGVGIFVKAEKT